MKNSFLQQPLPDLRKSIGDAKQKELAAAIDELRRSYGHLEQKLKENLPTPMNGQERKAADRTDGDLTAQPRPEFTSRPDAPGP